MKIERNRLGMVVTDLEYDQSIAVIGDVHGCYKKLIALLKQIPDDVMVVFVGDLVDRGPQSREVVEHIMSNNHLSTKGNHEEFMLSEFISWQKRKFINGRNQWLIHGGKETLASYDYNKLDENKNRLFDEEAFTRHSNWMASLPIYIEFPEVQNKQGKHLVVSHSSAAENWDHKFDPAYEHVFAQNTLWQHLLRNSESEHGYRSPKKIDWVFNIFGHTPIITGPKVGRHFAAVDGGAFFDNGKLIAYQFPEGITYIQDEPTEE